MEGPLAPVQQAAHAAMLDGRDWLAEERRMLYLFFCSPPQSLFLSLFFHCSLVCSWPACGWGREKEGDWEQEIKRLYGLCIKQSILNSALSWHPSTSFSSFIFQSTTLFIQTFFNAPSPFACLFFFFSLSHACGKFQFPWNKWLLKSWIVTYTVQIQCKTQIETVICLTFHISKLCKGVMCQIQVQSRDFKVMSSTERV